MSWMWNREPGEWEEVTDAQYGPPPPARGTSMRATFVNHATVLLQTHDLNILTDPIWSERASPVSWAGPKRMRPPGIRFDDLPRIDVVIISHAHYDHMDLETLKRLYQRDKPRFLVGLGNASLLEGEGISGITELDWWQPERVTDTTVIHAVPSQHFSMRWLNDRNQRLWLGYVIETPEGKVYFAGDTGMGPHFKQIQERFGDMRLSLLPIGAYKPRWFMAGVHLNPHDAVVAHKTLHSETSIGIHFGTFRLADDGQFDPINDLAAALEQEQVSRKDFWVLDFGEGRQLP
jgi:L-ascorbate metabolism protein UlaG (beta-lactamase superfamily)